MVTASFTLIWVRRRSGRLYFINNTGLVEVAEDEFRRPKLRAGGVGFARISQELVKAINKRQTLVIAAVLLALIGAGLYAARILPIRVRSMDACVSILKQLDGAKSTWALEYQKTTNDIPTDSDLFGPNSYIREKKKCPRGGSYTIGRIGELPNCSIP